MGLRAKKPAEPPGRGLWRQMTVRHRAPGHLRFDLPAACCTPEAASRLEREMAGLDGVYRVTVFAGARKLSIRWTEELCPLTRVVGRLASVVDGIGAPVAVVPVPPLERIKRAAPIAKLRARWSELKAKGQVLSAIMALKVGRKPPLPAEAGEWAINFANDLVMFYLVRVHWQRITKLWLPNPWTYRYQWLTVVYLIFLLVRHRKAKRAGAEAEPPPPCCGTM